MFDLRKFTYRIVSLKFLRNYYIAAILLIIPGMHFGQSLTLEYMSHNVIEMNNFEKGKIGGLSAITAYNDSTIFIASADKAPARFYKIVFEDNGSKVNVADEIIISPNVLQNSELEGIVYCREPDCYYVSDEQDLGTRIMMLDESGKFKRIILPINQPFLPLSGHNSGLEGLSLSGDCNKLYFAYERPDNSCYQSMLTTIGEINLSDGNVNYYPYQLHPVNGDGLNDNGISEILWLSDSSLLVMERAFVPGQGNTVRLYETFLNSPVSMNTPYFNCGEENYEPVKTILVYDFAKASGLKIDNAEGITFNKNRSELIIITDNNFSNNQETQLITLKVSWK